MNVTPLVDTRGAGTSQAARRRSIRRPSLSHILIATAVVLAFVLNFLALQDRGETTLVAVANDDISAGSRLGASDVRFVPIGAGFEGLASLVTESDWALLDGWVVTNAIPANGVISVESLSEPVGGHGMRSMSVPVGMEHAAGGLLEVGDTVDVLTVDEDGPHYVVAGVAVVAIAQDGGGIGGFGGFHVVLAVDAEQALALAGAIDAGSVEIIRSTGAPPIANGGRDAAP